MWLLPVVAGATVPHAPLLLPGLTSPEVDEASSRVRAAVASIDLGNPDLVILLTPHGGSLSVQDGMGYGFYREGGGSLADFGFPSVVASAELNAGATKRLGELSGWRTRPGPIDHGAVVPLALRSWGPAMAIASFLDLDGVERPSLDAIDEVARDYVHAIEREARDHDVAVIASVNGCAGLSPRAPLTETSDAIAGEDWLLEAVSTDLGSLAEWDGALERLARGGSCGLGPLQVFGGLFVGRRGRVLAHEAPVGVGYLVAEVV